MRLLEAARVRQHGWRSWGRLGFDGVAGLDPRPESAQDGCHPGEPIFQQNLRRTGARFLGRSSAVGDEPRIRIELTFAIWESIQRDRQRAGDMSALEGALIPHIDEDRRPRLVGLPRVRQIDPRDILY